MLGFAHTVFWQTVRWCFVIPTPIHQPVIVSERRGLKACPHAAAFILVSQNFEAA